MSREHRYGSGFSALLSVYRYSAKKRKLKFNLTTDEVFSITQKCCEYCGAAPHRVSKKCGSKGKPYTYNGIDRVDSSIGYLSGNVVPCCWTCGRAKRKLSITQFKKLVLFICEKWPQS